MNNALVIKNANFLANKVTTINFVVSCEGIEFDESTVTFDSLGTATVGYTVTPSDTTDTVSFTSSDSSIISVSGSTLTVNGIGSCTLTITCGEYSDTCTVTVDIYENPIYTIGSENIQYPSTTGQEYDGLKMRGNALGKFSCAGKYSDGYFEYPITYELASYGFDPGSITAIKIPNNTKKIHVYYEGASSSAMALIQFLDADNHFIYNGVSYIPRLSYANLSNYYISDGKRILDDEAEVPDGCSGYCITFSPVVNGFKDAC